MNVLEFIEEFVEDPRFESTYWRDALAIYEAKEDSEACTEGYFRTQYNNTRKRVGLPTKPTKQPKIIFDNFSPPIRTNNPVIIEETEEQEPFVLETEYIDESEMESFDPTPIPTGKFLDNIIGQYGGWTRSSVNVFAGEPGSGKTSTLVAAAVECIEHREQEIKALKSDYEIAGKEWDEENPPLKPITANIIHGEMRKKEWMIECHQVPYFSKLGMIFLREHRGKSNYLDVLKQALSSADIVIVDSFPVILSHMRISYPKMAVGAILYEVIDLFTDTADEANNVINVINQVNKDGSYKGGTELVHMVSAFAYFKIHNRKRYIEFAKNRNCGGTINRKLFFDRDENKRLIFNEEAYETTYNRDEDKEASVEEFLGNIAKNSDIEASVEEMQNISGYTGEENVEPESEEVLEEQLEISE